MASVNEGSDAVELVIEPRKRPVGNGTVDRLLPFRQRRMVGPFIFVDRMGPSELGAGRRMDIDAHPHIGLSTLTYLFDGNIVHRDSTGAVATIEPGAVNWMTAGPAVAHTERTHPDDDDRQVSHDGLQTWVALPTHAEDDDAFFEHAGADDVPTDRHGDVEIRMLTGTGWGLASPITGSSPLVFAELMFPADPDNTAGIPIDGSHPEIAVYPIDGDAFVDGARVTAGTMAVLRSGATPRITGSGRVMVIGGEPVGKRFIWWNFVHSDQDRIEDAKAAWMAQRWPTVPDDHDPWIPLP